MSAYAVIRENLEDPGTSFVFPSEVTARFWCRASLGMSRCRTLPFERFLSWDQFKQMCFHYPGGRKAVNRAARLLFLCRELAANKKNPFFSLLIPPQYAQQFSVFLEPLQRLLPALHRLSVIRADWPEFSREKLEDLLKLYTDYSSFLAQTNLYEPGYARPLFRPEDKRYLLFFPELIEDYAEFAGIIGDRAEITVVSVPGQAKPGSSIRVFDSITEEVRAVLREVAELLDRGIDTQQIVLTVGELKELEPYLRRQAELYEVPLIIHLGKALSDFPIIRLLLQIRPVVESAFSVPALKSFLLNHAAVWKQAELCRGLIRLGVSSRIVKNEGSGEQDSWTRALEAAWSSPELRRLPLERMKGFYSSLKRRLPPILRAESFRRLKESLTAFAADFLDLPDREDDDFKVFQFALDTLDDLDWAGPPASVPASQLFPIWLTYLQSSLYVPRQAGAGVPVYPYRVTAGINPEHHFIVNASQASTGHLIRSYPFLSIHEEEHLAGAQRDLSAEFLLLYSESGADVRFSYCRRGMKRSNLPPASLLSRGVRLKHVEAAGGPDSYELERQAWAGSAAFSLLPVQKQGYWAARPGTLQEKPLDATVQELQSAGLIVILHSRGEDETGALRISATGLESFCRCPFQYLLEHLLHLKAEDYEVVISDPREFGNIMHRTLQAFFLNLGQEPEGVRLEPSRRQEYEQAMKQTAAEVCELFRARNPVPLEPIWLELRRRAVELAVDFLDIDLETMSEERTITVEAELRVPIPETRTVLTGKIDRVARNRDGYTVVDYKKKNVPTSSDIFAPDPVSLQMPFYIHLMQENDRPVSRAAFYSIENRRYHFVFGGPGKNMAEAGEVAASVQALKVRVGAMRDRIAKGDYRIGNHDEQQCRYCSFAEICRQRYSAEKVSHGVVIR